MLLLLEKQKNSAEKKRLFGFKRLFLTQKKQCRSVSIEIAWSTRRQELPLAKERKARGATGFPAGWAD